MRNDLIYILDYYSIEHEQYKNQIKSVKLDSNSTIVIKDSLLYAKEYEGCLALTNVLNELYLCLKGKYG